MLKKSMFFFLDEYFIKPAKLLAFDISLHDGRIMDTEEYKMLETHYSIDFSHDQSSSNWLCGKNNPEGVILAKVVFMLLVSCVFVRTYDFLRF